ncbi:hypothetical protein NB16F79_43270 [Escherichia coli]
MLGGADNPNGELPSYITGADMVEGHTAHYRPRTMNNESSPTPVAIFCH